jgi:hypothetical protein
MVKKRSMGLSLQQVVKELHAEFKVSRSWLYSDWRNRDRWLPIILDLKDSKRTYWDCVAFHRQIRDWAVLQYLKADNSNAAIGALNLLRGLNHDFMELFPESLIASVSGKRGEELNEVLKEYEIALKALPKVKT